MKVWIDDQRNLHVGSVLIRADDIHIRATTSGGPGGQHANRSLTKIVVTYDHRVAPGLTSRQRALLIASRELPFQSSSSTFRSQSQNRDAAMLRLGERLAEALTPAPPRRATKPTKSSVQRRLTSKKKVAERKQSRRHRDDD